MLNLLFVVWWFICRKKKALLSLITILLGVFLGTFDTIVKIPQKIRTDTKPQLRLLTYNVNLFGLKYKPEKDYKFKEIADFVNKGGGDIICLQEYFTKDSSRYSEDAFNTSLTRYPFHYVHYNLVKNNQKFGIATYSKHKIVAQGNIGFQNTTNAAIFTDIAMPDSQIIRVYNVHLQSVRMGNKERDLILQEDFLLHHENKQQLMVNMYYKIKIALSKRAQQVELVAQHIKTSPFPVIVCGDFNDMPFSYTYRQMRGNLHDGFMDAGRGIMSTYRSFIPSFRIDYTLYDPMFTANAYFCPNVEFSDHYPLICRLVSTKALSNQ
jgi:endonuclease/exonuclease/phosphatase family metal-dependent hydrolase